LATTPPGTTAAKAAWFPGFTTVVAGFSQPVRLKADTYVCWSMTMKRCLALILLTGAIAAASDLPLAVSDVVTGPKSHVRITNRSSQPVTAWSLAVITHPDPDRTHREVYTADGYLSEATHGLPGASENVERLLPGQSRELPLDPLPADAKVEVAAVVLGDG